MSIHFYGYINGIFFRVMIFLRGRMMSDAEVSTILICFHFNIYRNFKHQKETQLFYTKKRILQSF